MGIKDLFSRGTSDDPSAVPHGDEPGESTTQYDDGRGTVGLGDRIGGGAPDTNQGKTEPMPPTPGHADPVGAQPHTSPPAVPELGDMNVGAADAQAPSPTVLASTAAPTATAGSGGPRPQAVSEVASRLAEGGHGAGGTVPAEDRPQPGSPSSSSGSGQPEMPVSSTTGTAHRAPGLQGETPEGENIDTDVQLGADRMVPRAAPDRSGPPEAYPGDSQGVNVPHELPAEGTSEEQGIVHGVKDPAT